MPRMISDLCKKMLHLKELSIPVQPTGWDILRRDIRQAASLHLLNIRINLGSRDPYQMAEEVKAAITGSTAPLHVITITRKKKNSRFLNASCQMIMLICPPCLRHHTTDNT